MDRNNTKNIIIFFLLFVVNPVLSQKVDSLTNVLKIWKLNDKFEKQQVVDDTSRNMFHVFKPKDKKNISSAHLGNMGSANISEIFVKRVDEYNVDFLFRFPYYIFQESIDNIRFYNTRKPYSEIFYTTASKIKDELTLNFMHTQNVHPRLNFAVDYKLISSKGQYLNQENKLNTFSFNTNYKSKKERYSMHAGIVYNKFKLQDNGGLIDTAGVDLSSLEANLSNAGTVLYYRNFFISHKYSLGKLKLINYEDTIFEKVKPYISFGHHLSYKNQYRNYFDVESSGNGYYRNYFNNTTETYDSLAYSSVTNIFRFTTESEFVKKFNFSAFASVENSIKQFYNFKEYVFKSQRSYYVDDKFTGGVSIYPKKIKLSAYGNIYFSGYRIGDFRVNLAGQKIFNDSTSSKLSFLLRYTSQKPDFYTNTFYSNHYRWENDFDNRQTTQFSLKFELPLRHFEVGASAVLLNNYIYFGSVSEPQQFDQNITILSAHVKKDFHFRFIHFHNKLIWQKSDKTNVISLPEVAIFHSTYVELNYKQVLKTHIGFDVYFTTKYTPYSYNPAIGNFYYENTGETGNYPFGSVFINAKIKNRALLFLKFEHANSGIFQELYYFVNHYPVKERTLRFGVRWFFNN